ncbi:hypothetical protein [Nocardia abscessus]|uniref:hypothetical protein n=1 Tax=Nocardia abscessus TaxID=120957 RepID=UPI002455925E|nr:hypothetical protein [Nocardia abscessus]
MKIQIYVPAEVDGNDIRLHQADGVRVALISTRAGDGRNLTIETAHCDSSLHSIVCADES